MVGPGAAVSMSERGEMLRRSVGRSPGMEWSRGGSFDAGATEVTLGE